MAEAIRGQLADNFGRPISGATVTVYKRGTAVAADLFSDYALTAGISNPITSEIDGSYLAFAPNGVYDLVFIKAGYTFDSTDSVGEVLFDTHIVRSVNVSGAITEKDYVLLVDASSAPVVLSLPALATLVDGRPFVVIKTDGTANAVTIDPDGTEQISGALTLSLTAAKQGVIFAKGGSEWVTYQPTAQETSAAGKIPLGRSADGALSDSWIRAQETSDIDKVPKGRSSDGKLSASWGGGVTSLATLNSTTKVVETALKSDALTMQGENGAETTSSTVSLDLGTVVAGDRILVSCAGTLVISGTATEHWGEVSKQSGSAVIQFFSSASSLRWALNYKNTGTVEGNMMAVLVVNTGGTLVLQNALFQTGGSVSSQNNRIYAFFLRKM